MRGQARPGPSTTVETYAVLTAAPERLYVRVKARVTVTAR
jgi:hypothetical protein